MTDGLLLVEIRTTREDDIKSKLNILMNLCILFKNVYFLFFNFWALDFSDFQIL